MCDVLFCKQTDGVLKGEAKAPFSPSNIHARDENSEALHCSIFAHNITCDVLFCKRADGMLEH
eukprot:scaffold55148_cov49-Cyclotella_meneghiniana.AAC.1